jgi:general stress protein 26
MKQETNLRGKKGIEKLKELVSEIKICLFNTAQHKDDWAAISPMTALKTDEKGNIWFLSNIESDKNMAIKKDKNVQLYFSHPSQNSYLIVNGDAEILTDQEIINELWSPVGSIWFKDGKNDPSISIIKVHTNNAYYWDVEGNKMVNCFRFIASAVTGDNKIESEQGFINI